MTRVAAITADTHDALANARQALAAQSAGILEMQMAIASIPSPTFGETMRGDWVAETGYRPSPSSSE